MQSSDDDSVSIDSDNAFAFVDFNGVDFGGGDDDDNDEPLEKQQPLVVEEVPEQVKDKPKECKKKSIARQPIDMPDGQSSIQVRTEHDPQLFKAQERRVQNLCKWYELGVRPSLSSSSLLNLKAHEGKDNDIFASKVDDLNTLLLRSIQAQDDLNTNLPPHPLGEYEDQLKIAPSTIKDAGNGLFALVNIPKGATVCNYAGYRHHYQSQKRLKDRAYVLKLQNGWPKHDRRNDGFINALPTKDVLARYINDPSGPIGSINEEKCNVKFEHIQEPNIWYCPVISLREIAEGEELFISYGPRYWSESRQIGG